MASNDNTSCLDGGQPADTVINKNSFVFQPLSGAWGRAEQTPCGLAGTQFPSPCQPLPLPPDPRPTPGRLRSRHCLWEGRRQPGTPGGAHWDPGTLPSLWAVVATRVADTQVVTGGFKLVLQGQWTWVWAGRGYRPKPKTIWC